MIQILMIKNILLFGSTGMLGNYINEYFKKYTDISIDTIDSKEFRVTKESLDSNILEDILFKKGINKYTCVINCIGTIPQRNTDKDMAAIHTYYIVNSIFPHILWNICKKYGAKMIHPTTDCVYSGRKGGYIESDIPDEDGHYGISKSLGEPSDCTVIRCSIIGREKFNKKSFMEFILNSKGEINGWSNHYWNGITCLEYCKVIQKICEMDLFWNGCRHIYSPESMSKYEMAKCIDNVFNISLTINMINTSDVCDKTLCSNYGISEKLDILPLDKQIQELYNFEI
jgi:dTDP-4-dehydrorhamnose reductase